MLIGVVEQNAEAAVLSFLEEVDGQHAAWGCARVKREHLKSVSNDEFVLAVKPALQNVSRKKIFFSDAGVIYVVWAGMLKQTYQNLCDTIVRSLLKPGSTVPTEHVVAFFDPLTEGNEIKILLKNDLQGSGLRAETLLAENRAIVLVSPIATTGDNAFDATPEQKAHYKKMLEQKQTRQKPYLLMVEDQPFLRKLLHEALHDNCTVDACGTAEIGWMHYLDRAPDIALLDIGLPEADGHTLAHKIKEFDPGTYVVMISANHQKGDVERALQNHVDGFVAKPFSKKKLDECIGRYMATHKRGA